MQGFNMGRYVPPDLEGTTSGNALHKKRPPGISQDGTQTVRFEMPFAIWCLHCENPNPPPHADSSSDAGGKKKGGKPTIIGQGVRFNATKRKVGNYHSTPIFAFRMRHAECGGSIEIRTDPKNTAYVVVEGARKRDTGDSDFPFPLSSSLSSVGPILTDKEKEALRSDAFAKLEKTIADRKVLEDARQRIEELEDESARKWEDPYERNRRLRDAFRVGRKERERDALKTESLRERMGLGIELLAASEEDARRAALVDFGPAAAAGEGEMGRKALAKPLFDIGVKGTKEEDGKSKSKSKSKSKRLKSEVAAAQMRESLVSEIVGNTRVAQDPFLSLDRGNGESGKGSSRFMGIKRKRLQSEPESDHGLEGSNEPGSEKGRPTDVEEEKISSSAVLVDYDSD
ncbi:DUF455 domain protein [Annulohypoxylon truncatum]|uniref:DUF455 domain protein n=1 Tax=Annulohypoxylon truncatum TaxID=327061 RepID=UPI0020086A71|nr:DUF455 domain protein [Annulohypoxylon truncatum]KAI1205534.1 DUF455 domain protein [Annulohypoxylon truncatum]